MAYVYKNLCHLMQLILLYKLNKLGLGILLQIRKRGDRYVKQFLGRTWMLQLAGVGCDSLVALDM